MARADEDDRTERASKASVSTAVRPEPQLEYYGWQIMSVDVASLLVGLAIPVVQQGAIIGVTGYALGGSVIHATHGRYGTSMTSLGLRLGLPVAGAALAGKMYRPESEEADRDEVRYMAKGLLLGAAAAAVIDWTVLGWTVKPPPGAEQASNALTPRVRVGKNSVSLGVQGRF